MGTRHIIAVVVDGKYRIAQYGQWDGYPSGQGVSVLAFLRAADLTELRRKAGLTVELSDADIEQIDKQSEGWGDYLKGLESIGLLHLSRDTGSKILNVVLDSPDGLRINNSIKFCGDGLVCEWAYVIDFDRGLLEAYDGFHQGPAPEGQRFAGYSSESGSEYGPVRFVWSWPLNALPVEEDFLAMLERPVGET